MLRTLNKRSILNHILTTTWSNSEIPPYAHEDDCYQKHRNQVLARMWRNRNPDALVRGNVKWRSCYRKQYGGSSKNYKWNYPMIRQSRFWLSIQKNWSRISKRYLQTCVHNTTTHDNQEAEATHVSIDGWTDEPNGADTYTGISVSLKKEGNSDTCYDTDEPSGPCAKPNKPVPARQILQDSTLGGGIQVVKVKEWESWMERGWRGHRASFNR